MNDCLLLLLFGGVVWVLAPLGGRDGFVGWEVRGLGGTGEDLERISDSVAYGFR